MLLIMPIAGQISSHVQPKYLMALGMFIVALSMWHLTSLTPGADFSYFSWARVFQTVGLPFLFIPITSASYADVPPNKTNQASALINVARNLGGSIGVSLATTMLAQREQFHQVRLTEHIVPSALPYHETLQSMSAYFASQGVARPDAPQHAIALIGQLVEMQSALLSYIDVFWAYAIVALLMTAPALLLVRYVDLRAAPAGH
jgi:MFS transporter, DHA2 family, multidrug resistance protein